MARAGWCGEIGHSHTDRLRFQEGMQVDPSRIQIRASPWILTFDSEIPGARAGSIKVQTIRCQSCWSRLVRGLVSVRSNLLGRARAQ